MILCSIFDLFACKGRCRFLHRDYREMNKRMFDCSTIALSLGKHKKPDPMQYNTTELECNPAEFPGASLHRRWKLKERVFLFSSALHSIDQARVDGIKGRRAKAGEENHPIIPNK